MKFEQPQTVDQALSLLKSGHWSILSGGTDVFPALGDAPPRGDMLDISRLRELKGITQDERHWSIGALATWSDLIAAELPAAFDALKQAGREVGSIQIQNRATIAGNICNASPAADGVPPLLCLDAEVELRARGGRRQLPLANFLQGNRKTALKPDEMVTAILVPKASAAGITAFRKLGARKYLVISIAMVAARLRLNGSGAVEQAAISVGACSAVARRLSALEQDLIGCDARSDFHRLVSARHLDCLSPIDDVRASARYRLDAARQLLMRTITDLLRR